MLTATQKRTAEAIVNVFETSSVRGDYGCVTLLEGDTGHLTYGRSQTTLGSGNLHALIERYCGQHGAFFVKSLEPYLDRLETRDLSLDHDAFLANLLRACADDRVMRDTQDAFFDEFYWRPAARAAERTGITTPLGVAIVYDSFVHGSWKTIRERTDEASGTIESIGERAWIAAYVKQRHDWLSSSKRLRSTVYRMRAFDALIEQGLWDLPLPLVVRGLEISDHTLNALPARCYDGPEPGSRTVMLQTPVQRGFDVRLVQLGLSKRGVGLVADGIFGRTTRNAVADLQTSLQQPATGAVEPALLKTLWA